MTQSNIDIQIGIVPIAYGWVIRNGKSVIRLKVQLENHNGKWGLPTGNVEMSEGLAGSAKNLLESRVGSKDIYIEQLKSYGDDKIRTEANQVSVFYIAAVPANKDLVLDTDSTKWVAIDIERGAEEKILSLKLTDKEAKEISELEDDHMQILMDALNRLQGKILYSNIALYMMGDTFTLSDAQMVYEEIMGRQFGAFRRYISDKVDQTDEYDMYSSRRPSRMFRMKG